MGPPKNREQFGKMDDCTLRFKCNGRWAREQVGRGWELGMGAWFFDGRQDAGATGKPHFIGEEPKSGLRIRRADLKFGHYIRSEPCLRRVLGGGWPARCWRYGWCIVPLRWGILVRRFVGSSGAGPLRCDAVWISELGRSGRDDFGRSRFRWPRCRRVSLYRS
jgi:hypothetical protein